MRFYALLVTLLAALLSPAAENSFSVTFTGLPTESLSPKKIDNFDDLKSKVVLIDFWASWCEPCKAALPSYEKLYQKYKDKGLVIIGINEDDNKKERDEFLKKNSFSFPMYADNSKKMISDFRVQAVPTLFVFKKGLQPDSFYRGFNEEKMKNLEKKVVELLK